MLFTHIVPQFPRLSDLLGQSVEINQQEIRQPLHSLRDLLCCGFGAMQCIVSIKTKFVRPLLERGCNQMIVSQLFNPLFQFPSFDFWREGFQRYFHAFAEHRCSGGPLLPLETIKSFYIKTSDILWSGPWCNMARCGRFDTKYGQAKRISKVALNVVYVCLVGVITKYSNRPIAFWTGKGRREITITSANVIEVTKYERSGSDCAPRAIMGEYRHA